MQDAALCVVWNGSLLMTSRLQHNFPHWQPDPANSTDPANKRRGFARSDDGGRTWAEWWELADRQPDIQKYTAECAHALVSDPSKGTMYWGHPGGGLDGHGRMNYTVETSVNGGKSWRKLVNFGPKGAGYSDAHLLHDGTLAIAYQKTFYPPAPGIEGGGYDIGFAKIGGLDA